jgi:hypothetical protein
MDIEKLWGRAAFIVPVGHVIVCSLFIFGFCAGFGPSISGLFTVSNFFTVTLQNLMVIYPVCVGFPLLAYYFMVRNDHDGTLFSAKFELRNEKAYYFAFWIVLTVSWSLFGLMIRERWQGYYVPWFFIAISAFVAMLPLVCYICAVKGVTFRTLRVTVDILYFVTTVIALGATKGDVYRRGSSESLQDEQMHCEKLTVLIPVGERFIAVNKNTGDRFVINEDCKAVFTFDTAQPYKYRTIRALFGSFFE